MARVTKPRQKIISDQYNNMNEAEYLPEDQRFEQTKLVNRGFKSNTYY